MDAHLNFVTVFRPEISAADFTVLKIISRKLFGECKADDLNLSGR